MGLSRVTSLSGLNILQLNASKISISSGVVEEMVTLRTERCIKDFPGSRTIGHISFRTNYGIELGLVAVGEHLIGFVY